MISNGEPRLNRECRDLPDVRDVRRHVILGSRIEVVLGSQHRRLGPGVLLHQPVPMAIVVLPGDVTAEHVPSPPVHRDAERQHHQFIHRQSEQVIDVRGRLVDVLVPQAESLQMTQSANAEGHGFADRFVEPCVNVSLKSPVSSRGNHRGKRPLHRTNKLSNSVSRFQGEGPNGSLVDLALV